MNILLGLVLALTCIVIGVPGLAQNWKIYIDLPSIALVVGGTVAVSLISARFKDMFVVLQIFTGIWFIQHKPVANDKAVAKLVEISNKAFSEGNQAVAEMGQGIGDGFLDRCLSLLGTGLEEEFIRKTLEADISNAKKRFNYMIGVVTNLGGFAPMFGMFGTTAGVVLVLQNVTDISSVVEGLAFALITTIYGLIMANILVTPITNQLKLMSMLETQSKIIMMEGVLSILRGDIPLKVEKYLASFLSDDERKKLEKKK